MSKSFKIKVITPSYVPESDKGVLASLDKMMNCGFKIDYSPRTISKKYNPFWGSIADRAEEVIGAMLGDYDAIWAVRGGYGSVQLMEYLDSAYHLLKDAKPKYLLGFSDITYLHYFIHKNLGWQSIHCDNFKSITEQDQSDIDAITEFLLHTRDEFVLKNLELLNGVEVNVSNSKVLGGNLCMMQNTISTSYHIDSKGCTLFVEDFDEPWYRIDRMIYHLYNSGYMKNADAVVFGRLTDNKLEEPRVYQVIKKFAKLLESYNVPVFFSNEFGHKGQNKPILIGGGASIESDDRSYTLVMRRKS